jgi:hypothetical protein
MEGGSFRAVARRMSREVVRERLGVKFPEPVLQLRRSHLIGHMSGY